MNLPIIAPDLIYASSSRGIAKRHFKSRPT
jgi:hypothetical protein